MVVIFFLSLVQAKIKIEKEKRKENEIWDVCRLGLWIKKSCSLSCMSAIGNMKKQGLQT